MNLIKNNSTLIVDPGLASIFVQNGKIEAIQEESGKWQLDTDNTPFLSSLKNIMSGFETHNKSQIYFLKSNIISNQKWGTPNHITYVDPVYEFPVELRAFGNFSFKICDVHNFWLNYVANKNKVKTDDVRMMITDRIVSLISSVLASKKISYNDISAHGYDIGLELKERTKAEFSNLGLELTDFRIENTNFTQKTQDFIDRVTCKSADVAAINKTQNIDRNAMNNFKELEQIEIAKKAATGGGAAGEMMSSSMGMAMGMNMLNQMQNNNSNNNVSNNSNGDSSIEQKLQKLKDLFDKGLISEDDYNKKRSEVISSL